MQINTRGLNDMMAITITDVSSGGQILNAICFFLL